MTNKMKLAVALAVTAVGLALASTPLRAQDSNDDPLQSEIMTVAGGNTSWLGVQTKDLTADQARDLKLGDEYGALVDKVEPDGPAAKAGLQKGDVIVEFAGERVRSVAELTRLVRETPPGRSVEIRVRRNGAKQTLNATIEAPKNGFEPLFGQAHNGRIEVWPQVHVPDLNLNFGVFGGPRLGVSVEELTLQLGDYFGVKDGKGVLVTEVSAGSAAEKAGLRAGDCIVRVDSTSIESADDIHRALSRKPDESRDVTLSIVRDRKEQTLQVHLEAPERPHFFPNTALRRLPQADQLEAEARALAPDADAAARQAEEIRRQFESQRAELEQRLAEARAQAKALADNGLRQKLESERGELEAQVAQARTSAKAIADHELQLRLQLLKDQGQWREQLKQLAPEMKELQKRLQQLRDQYAYGAV